MQCVSTAVILFLLVAFVLLSVEGRPANSTWFLFNGSPSMPQVNLAFSYLNRVGFSHCFHLDNNSVPFAVEVGSQCGQIRYLATAFDNVSEMVNDTVVYNVSNITAPNVKMELLLIDPWGVPMGVNLTDLLVNQSALRSFVNEYVSWTPPASHETIWDNVKVSYLNRTFSGALSATNLLDSVQRFVSADGSLNSFPMVIGTVPMTMQLVAALPVMETIIGSASQPFVEEDLMWNITDVLYFASAPKTILATDFASELQNEIFPRASIVANYSVPLTSSSISSGSQPRGVAVDLFSSEDTTNYSYSSSTLEFVRVDADWNVSSQWSNVVHFFGYSRFSKAKDLMVLDATSLAKVVNATTDNPLSTVRMQSSSGATQARVRSVLPTDLPVQIKSMRCFGLRWQGSAFNVSNATNGSTPINKPCIVMSTSSPSSVPSLRMCAPQTSILMSGYYLCSLVSRSLPTGYNSSRVPSPAIIVPFPGYISSLVSFPGSPVLRVGTQSITTVNVTTMQLNSTLAQIAFGDAADSTGQIIGNPSNVVATNLTQLFLRSSTYRNGSAPSSVDLQGGGFGSSSKALPIVPVSCFDVAQWFPILVVNVTTPMTTLFPLGSSAAYSSAQMVRSLLTALSVTGVTTVHCLLLQAAPQDGYCGLPWRVGLTARVLQDGLLIGYHGSAFASRSSLYLAQRSSSSSGMRCCASQLANYSNISVCASQATFWSTSCNANSGCISQPPQPLPANETLPVQASVSKQSNATISVIAHRCSYDVMNVKRNCSPAVGAFLQLVLVDPAISDDLMNNQSLLRSFAYTNPSATSLSGLALQLTNQSGIATFPAAGPTFCFIGSTVQVIPMFPTRGSTDGSSVISDGAVVSYYKGITSFECASQLFLVVRPSPNVCLSGLRTRFLGGAIGVPLGPLDTDIQDSCGSLISGVISVRLEQVSTVSGSSGSSSSSTLVSIAPLSTTLAGVLEQKTNTLSDDYTLWRGTFVSITPTANVSSAALRMDMTMSSSALPAIGDVILQDDVLEVPYLSLLFLSNCSMIPSSWIRVPNRTLDQLAPLQAAQCGVAAVPLPILPTSAPIPVIVEMTTGPALVTADALRSSGVWINISFSLDCFPIDVSSSDLRQAVTFSSDLPPLRARRAFLYMLSIAGQVNVLPIQILEKRVNGSYAQTQNEVTTSYVLPIFVSPNPLYNNYNLETINISLNTNLLGVTSGVFALSKTSLSFRIFPNARPMRAQAVMWLSFLAMSGVVVRIGNVASLRYATSCSSDVGDHLDLVLHPLSFGIGSDTTTQFLVGAAVANTAVVLLTFLVHYFVDSVIIGAATSSQQRSGHHTKGTIDVEDPDAIKGLPTFPNWGLRMLFMLYPGIMLGGIRAVSLGLNTFLLYTIFLLLVLVGVGFPVLLLIGQRYYRPRWHENEALIVKEMNTVTSSSKRRQSARARLLAAKATAMSAVANSQQAVHGFFSKAMTPTGFYEINHADHVRFLSTYQDARGEALFAPVADGMFGLFYGIASALPCPMNQIMGALAITAHCVMILGFRPYITIARVLFNVIVDVGCLIAIVIALKQDREQISSVFFESILLFASALNFFGYFWAFWRSEGLRHAVRRRRRLSRKNDLFRGRGSGYQTALTSILKMLEQHLYGLHSVKPDVVYRRDLRRRRMLLENVNGAVDSSSGSPTDDDIASRSMTEMPTLTTLAAAMAASTSNTNNTTPASVGIPKSPQQNASIVSVLSPMNLQASVDFSTASPTGSPTLRPESPLSDRSSRMFRSTMVDEYDSDDNPAETTIHADAPEAMSEGAKIRRRFAANRFKAYIRTESGKPFGRSDENSVVRKLVIGPDGVREVREWREGTVELANEEMRNKQKMQAELKKLTQPLESGMDQNTIGQAAASKTASGTRVDVMKKWEDAFAYEIARSHGVDVVRTDNTGKEVHETLLQRRMRVMGERVPTSFELE